MDAKHLATLAACGLGVTGCGVTAAHLTAAPAHVATATTARTVVAPGAPAASATTPAAATPTATPAPPTPQLVVAASNGYSGRVTVTLLDTTGATLATAQVPQPARWTISAGGGAAWWVSGGALQRLDRSGHVTRMAAMPATQSGAVAVSPDGTQWVYTTYSGQDANGVAVNTLYRGGVGAAAVQIAQRTSDPRHPSTDAPAAWQYSIQRWTAQGVLVERQPTGGCGCGVPFDMEMSASSAAYIDPVSGVATDIPVSGSCTLSGAGDGTAACFHHGSGAGDDRLEFLRNGAVSGYSLSGASLGGDAVFNGTTLAYATVADNAGGCGGPDWRPLTTLRVMDITTGSARAVGPSGLAPAAWLATGDILATRTAATGDHSDPASVVMVDPATGAVRTLLNQDDRVVGVA